MRCLGHFLQLSALLPLPFVGHHESSVVRLYYFGEGAGSATVVSQRITQCGSVCFGGARSGWLWVNSMCLQYLPWALGLGFADCGGFWGVHVSPNHNMHVQIPSQGHTVKGQNRYVQND